MSYQYWMGTEASLHELQALEAEVAELRRLAAARGDRQAFLFLDDEDDMPGARALGHHLIERIEGSDTALLKVAGSLVPTHQAWHPHMAGRVTSYEALAGAAHLLAEDDSVKRVVLKVASSGGAVTGVDRAAERIRWLDRHKPVVSHVDSMAFSAGYWLASSAREVVAGGRMAEFGSIGTLMVHQSLHRMAQDEGIDVTVFRAGDHKAMGHPLEALTDEARAYLQADVDKTNTFFLEHVSRRRNLMISDQRVWADGKTFFAAEAQSVGLVDRIADLDDLIIRASSAANHHRSYGMSIPAEKLARIEAGASPEDVLNDAELTAYQTALAEEPEAEPEAQAAEPEPEQELDFEPEARTAEAAAHTQLLKDLGRLEAKLETRDERISELEAKLAAREETFASLTAIGIEAVNKRQLALGKVQSQPATAEALISTFHELSAEMTKRFPVGQQSRSADLDNDGESAGNIPRHLQVRKGA